MNYHPISVQGHINHQLDHRGGFLLYFLLNDILYTIFVLFQDVQRSYPNVSGSSEIFKGCHVVYRNQAKIDLLGVNHRTIDAYGAVSREVAEEMANKVKNIFSTDYGLSVTGIAGPGGGTEEKPVGLVYIGLSDENKTEIRKYNFSSNRTNNKSNTSQVALDWLRHKLIND